MSICARKGVVPFAPFLENDALIYKNDPNLRNFILAKRMCNSGLTISSNTNLWPLVLNSERASLLAHVFTDKFERTRREQLELLMDGYFDEDKASKVCRV